MTHVAFAQVTSSALPYQGRYPCASFAYKGVYYVRGGPLAVAAPASQSVRVWKLADPITGCPYDAAAPQRGLMQEGAVSQVGTYAIAETWGRTTDQHGKPVPLNRQCAWGRRINPSLNTPHSIPY